MLILAETLSQRQIYPLPDCLLRAFLYLICCLPALLFPLLATKGRKSWAKALLLIPALIAAVCGIFQYRLTPLLFLPVFLVLLLAVIWYFTNKNRWLGMVIAAIALVSMATLPFLSAMVGIHLQRLGFEPLVLWSYLKNSISILFSRPHEFIRLISFTSLPLPVYALLGQLASTGLLSAKLPKEVASPPPAPQPQPVPASAQRFCTQCGVPLDLHARFCTKCGKPVQRPSTR